MRIEEEEIGKEKGEQGRGWEWKKMGRECLRRKIGRKTIEEKRIKSRN